jgi:hypothetical protein
MNLNFCLRKAVLFDVGSNDKVYIRIDYFLHQSERVLYGSPASGGIDSLPSRCVAEG